MQKLLHDIKPDIGYRKAVSEMRAIDIYSFIAREKMEKGHSPYAFERITLWLKYQRGISVTDIIKHLSEFNDESKKLKKVHKNSWFRWSTPSRTDQSNNIYHETWVPLRDAINALLASRSRSIDNFTHEPTYTPENIALIRQALGLDYNKFARIVGFTSGKIAKQMEDTDPTNNRRGAGFDDWKEIIRRIDQARIFKEKITKIPVLPKITVPTQ
ncbi:hypothetical protein [Psychrobacter sp. AOP31-A1-22]|uniref:hypothetical protein n=1 Tax=Psychrobacter sp. AOP31-A1-22 TaxID=3457696 RepID=UPI004036F013